MARKIQILVLGLTLGLAAAAGLSRAHAQTADEPEKPRVIVLPDEGAGREDLNREAASLLIRDLMKNGYRVVSLELAERADRLTRSVRKGGKGGPPIGCREMYASILIRVGVEADRERKLQGRYRVEDVMRIRMSHAEDTTILLEDRTSGQGTSFDGYRKAHIKAVESLCSEVCKKVTTRLDELVEEEKQKGALFTLGLFAEGKDNKVPATFAARLRGVEGIQPDTISLARSDLRNGYFEYRLRYRGRSHSLVEALFKTVQEAVAAAKEQGQTLEMDFMASTRRVLLFLRTRKIEPDTSLDGEVQRQVNALTDMILKNQKEALAAKRLAVEPTSIPSSQGPKAALDAFARAYFRALDAGERKSAAAGGGGDEMHKALDRGPVFISGTRFPTLRAARARLDELAGKYNGSRAGTLASDIAKLVVASMKKGKLNVLPAESDLTAVLDRIKREAALYQEEGAVDPETISLLSTTGAEGLVMTWFRPFLESYMLRIAVIDCSTGEEIVHLNRILHRKFKADLDKIFNS